MKTISINDVIQTNRKPVEVTQLPQPDFNPSSNERRIVLGVSSMRDHMSDEGYQITSGLASNGYTHVGHGLDLPLTHIPDILKKTEPGTVLVQDIREWGKEGDSFRDLRAEFTGISELQKHPEIFRLTILKDSHQRPQYHSDAAQNMSCHAWVVYYHPRIVNNLAPYTRLEHLIRTYHSVDLDVVCDFKPEIKEGCLLSGAISGAYPLRKRIHNVARLLGIDVLAHPGYHRNGTNTPGFFKTLEKYKVHICTASRYGYALRKIVESSAAGCRVITDLPIDDVLPEIDENLIRISPDIPISDLSEVVRESVTSYDPEKQDHIRQKTLAFYNVIDVTRRLADDIESLRKKYNG